MKHMKLTAKQQMFVDEYLIDLNGTQAAIRAGYSKNTANRIANQNLSKLDIKNAIEEAKSKRAERTQIDSDYVLAQIQEYLDHCFGRKPIKKILNVDGVYQTIEVEEFNPTGIGKALDLLGKHIDVQAFKEKKEIQANIENSVESRIANMSQEEREARIIELQKKLNI
ncbi:terminase small subunit [Colwelliaceae bacterium BS250]